MLTEDAIRRALHASRVVPLEIANPHGPLGPEQLAAAVAAHRQTAQTQIQTERVCRPIELPLRTWEKLRDLAAASSQAGAPPLAPANSPPLLSHNTSEMPLPDGTQRPGSALNGGRLRRGGIFVPEGAGLSATGTIGWCTHLF